jgi:hypothetical protein
MSFNSANCRGQLVTLTLLDRTDVFNMPSWDIALCQLVNVGLLHDTYLVKQTFVLLYLRDKFRDRPHVHIVFHLASRLLLPLVPRRQQLHCRSHSANMHNWGVLFPSNPSGCLVYFCTRKGQMSTFRAFFKCRPL